jgi:UDP-N-acetylmuramoyl-tripeptide--D-alanyl-D-alanine ligase
MNHRGEISALSLATEPDVCLITNIGTAHIGNLGSREMIAAAKLEIEDGVKHGEVVVPANEPLLKKAKRGITLSFEKNTPADITFTRANKENSNSDYVFSYCGKEYEIKINSYDKRLIKSIANSLSVCGLLDIDPYEITDGGAVTYNFEFRQKLIEKNGYKIYDDTYSASLEATLCVVDSLIDEHGKISCVLGDMLELGDLSNAIHKKLGYELSCKSIDTVYLFGNYAKSVLEGLTDNGSRINVFVNTNTKEPNVTADQIKENYKGELLLVKGSRNMHTEKIIELLIK